MSEEETQIQTFNTYYVEFLKRIVAIAKPKKQSGDKIATALCAAVKKSYKSMDLLSKEYINDLEKTGIWEAYDALEDREKFTGEFIKRQVYKGITIYDLDTVTGDAYFTKHLIATLNIVREKIVNTKEVLVILTLLNKSNEYLEKVETISDEKLKEKLVFLHLLHTNHKKGGFADNLKEIEETSLGKLAKEIMGDLNIEELQKTMNDPNMNIFESLKDTNGGLGQLLSTVSQKMLAKIGSGALNQETLLADAIDLAGKLPKLMPEGMGSQLGNIGEMLSQLQKMSGKTGGGDNSNPMEMMQELMKGMNLNKTQKKKATSRMNSSINKNKISSRLKKKLQKRKENNIQSDVEEDE